MGLITIRQRRTRASALLVLIVLMVSSARAQDLAARQAATDEGFIDKAQEWAANTQIVERLNGTVDGWYPRLGRMTRGSGIAVGPGYRTHLFGGHVFADVSAGISLKAYKAVDANIRWFEALDERIEVWTDFRYEDFPQEDFFGVGLGSSLATRTSYDFDSSDLAVRVRLRPLSWLRTGVTFGRLSPEIGTGSDKNYPSIEQLFTDAEAPGLIDQPRFLHTTLFADIDYRDTPGNPATGGFYRFAWGVWDDRTLEAYDFRRFDLNATQFFPLVPSKRHVVSGNVGLSYVNNATGHRVPFYFLPYVGGADTIRSFREFRFKDENALWLNAEYKWSPKTFLSVAAFVDAGEVHDDWQEIDLRGLKHGYGVGLRLHTAKQALLRLDVATGGGEGVRMFLKLSPSF